MVCSGQMREERRNFRSPEITGMFPRPGAIAMKFQEPPDPLHISLLGAQAVMFDTQDFAKLVEEFGFGIGNDERSLWREHFGRHNGRKCNNDSSERNQNLAMAGRCYAAFWLPNIC